MKNVFCDSEYTLQDQVYIISLIQIYLFSSPDMNFILSHKIYRNCEKRQGHPLSFVSKYSKLGIIRITEE